MEKKALSFLLLISITMFCLFADQNLMAPNLSLMAEEFHFNAKERDEKLGGYIAFGFFIVGGPVALIVGYFTDSINRCLLFSVVITIGACASLSTYWVRNYGELFLCRVLTGISIGGVNPVVFSILGDLFPESSRVHVSMVIGISQSSGIAAGQFMAGMIGPRYGWRLPFLLTSMPTLLTGLIVIFALKDPKRGQQERAFQTIQSSSFKNQSLSITVATNPLHGKDSAAPLVENDSSHHQSQGQMIVHSRGAAEDQITSSPFQEEYLHYSEKIEWEKVKRIFQTPSVVIIFLQGFPGCLPWGMIYVFLNDYLSTNRHMTIEAATITLTSFGVGGIIGQLFGGYFGQKLYNHNPRYQTILMGTSTLLAIAPMLLLINIEFSSLFVICFVAFIGGFVINMNGPNVRAVLQV
jgi:predicted MFS family arabinose efflux permease